MRAHHAFRLVLVPVLLAACGSAVLPSGTPTATGAPSTVVPPATPALSTITPVAAIAYTDSGAIEFDGTVLWFVGTSGRISRIDPATNTIGVPTIIFDPMSNDGAVAVNGAGLWFGNYDTNLVYRIDPATLTVVAKIPAGANPTGAGATDTAIWIANHRGGSVTRIDPATNAVVATITVSKPGPGGPHGIGLGLGSVWVSAGNPGVLDTGSGGTVVRIDPATNAITATIQIPPLGSACGGFAISEQAVWMDSCGDQRNLIRIDPTTNKVVATIDIGGYGWTPVLINGAPWLALSGIRDTDPGRLLRIDPASNTVDRVVSLGDAFKGGGLVVAAGSVWVTDVANNQVLRLPLAAFTQ